MSWRSRASAVMQAIYAAAAPTLTSGAKTNLYTDINGNLKTRTVGPMGADGVVVPMGAALVKVFSAKGSAGTLRYLEGWAINAAADNRYLLIGNKATALVATDPAVFTYPLPGSANNLFPIVLPFPDMPFSLGIQIAISTTPYVYTVPVAAELAIGAIIT